MRFDTRERGECDTQTREGHNTAWDGIGTEFQTQW